MGYTFAEKILGRKAGVPVQANDDVVVTLDCMMTSDTTAPLAIKSFREMGGERLAKPESSIFVLDHATPCPNERIANLHKHIRDFAIEQDAVLYDQGAGICHQVLLERGHVGEGDVVLGADSHTCSYGAVGAFATGVGSTDLGAAFRTGKTWLRVPETLRFELTGALPAGVSAKDVILQLVGDMTSDGANYLALEFAGDGFAAFLQEEAITVCNMSVEMGAKSGVFVPALSDPSLIPDADAVYTSVIHYDAGHFVPVVACPHTVDNVKPASDLRGQRVDLAYLGSCTNGRLGDIRTAADILRGKRLAPHTRMIVCPASSAVMREAIARGYIADLIDAGAALAMPGCGLCVGTLGGVPADGETVISTSNRNFLGRMGNNKAFVYLSSPATAAASALTGTITDPREVC